MHTYDESKSSDVRFIMFPCLHAIALLVDSGYHTKYTEISPSLFYLSSSCIGRAFVFMINYGCFSEYVNQFEWIID